LGVDETLSVIQEWINDHVKSCPLDNVSESIKTPVKGE
jgi:hypothetical protein